MEHLSPLDAAFLDLEDRHSALHVGGIAVLDGPVPDPQEMSQVYERSLALDPRYRRRMRRARLQLARPAWVDDPRFDPDYHLRRTAVAAPGGQEELDRLVGRIMSVRLDEARPPWEAWVIEGLANGQWALLTKLHHSLTAGLGGMSLFTDMLDSAQAAPLLPPVVSPTRVREVLDTVSGGADRARRTAQELVAAGLKPRRTLRAAAQTAGGAVGFVRGLRPTEPTSLTGPLGTPRRYRTFTVELADMRSARRALGGTVNDVALAMVTRGFRNLLLARGEGPTPHAVRCLVPVSAPSGSNRDDGCQLSALLLDLPVDFADARVAGEAVVARTRSLKQAREADGGQLGVTLASWVPPPLFYAALRVARRLPQRMLTTIATNVPGPPRPAYVLGRRMAALYPYVPIAERLRIGIALTSYAERMQFGVTCDRDSVGDVDVLIAGIVAGLAELVKLAEEAAGGSTA